MWPPKRMDCNRAPLTTSPSPLILNCSKRECRCLIDPRLCVFKDGGEGCQNIGGRTEAGNSGHFKIGYLETSYDLAPAGKPSCIGNRSDSFRSYRSKQTLSQACFTLASHSFLITPSHFQVVAPIQSLYGMNTTTAMNVHTSRQNQF